MSGPEFHELIETTLTNDQFWEAAKMAATGLCSITTGCVLFRAACKWMFKKKVKPAIIEESSDDKEVKMPLSSAAREAVIALQTSQSDSYNDVKNTLHVPGLLVRFSATTGHLDNIPNVNEVLAGPKLVQGAWSGVELSKLLTLLEWKVLVEVANQRRTAVLNRQKAERLRQAALEISMARYAQDVNSVSVQAVGNVIQYPDSSIEYPAVFAGSNLPKTGK